MMTGLACSFNPHVKVVCGLWHYFAPTDRVRFAVMYEALQPSLEITSGLLAFVELE
jgi:hypothetical protein